MTRSMSQLMGGGQSGIAQVSGDLIPGLSQLQRLSSTVARRRRSPLGIADGFSRQAIERLRAIAGGLCDLKKRLSNV
jgi:hypothetical protein